MFPYGLTGTELGLFQAMANGERLDDPVIVKHLSDKLASGPNVTIRSALVDLVLAGHIMPVPHADITLFDGDRTCFGWLLTGIEFSYLGATLGLDKKLMANRQRNAAKKLQVPNDIYILTAIAAKYAADCYPVSPAVVEQAIRRRKQASRIAAYRPAESRRPDRPVAIRRLNFRLGELMVARLEGIPDAELARRLGLTDRQMREASEAATRRYGTNHPVRQYVEALKRDEMPYPRLDASLIIALKPLYRDALQAVAWSGSDQPRPSLPRFDALPRLQQLEAVRSALRTLGLRPNQACLGVGVALRENWISASFENTRTAANPGA